MEKTKNCIRCKNPFPYDGLDICEDCLPLDYMNKQKLGQMLQEMFDIFSDNENKMTVDMIIRKVSNDNSITGNEVLIKRSFKRYLRSQDKVKCHACKKQINKISTQKFKVSGIRICYKCLLLIDSSDFKNYSLMTEEEVKNREINQVLDMLRKNQIKPLHTFERSSVGS
jgi:hypothetical protein